MACLLAYGIFSLLHDALMILGVLDAILEFAIALGQ